jgi:hypothetical protein
MGNELGEQVHADEKVRQLGGQSCDSVDIANDSGCGHCKSPGDIEEIIENGAFKGFDVQASAVIFNSDLLLQDSTHAIAYYGAVGIPTIRITMTSLGPPTGGRVP